LIRELEGWELVRFLGSSNCPVCGHFVPIHCEKTESNILTSTAECKRCNHVISADRTTVIPYETLGGHLYRKGE